jgi:hypothetical protein
MVEYPSHAGVLYITGQQTKDIPEGQQGIPLTSVHVTASADDDQTRPGFHRLAGELIQQAGFAPAGFTSDKNDPALPLYGSIQVFMEHQ